MKSDQAPAGSSGPAAVPDNGAPPIPLPRLNRAGAGFSKMRRALVVEDAPGIRDLLARALELDGYEVDSAADGISGWKKMAEVPAELVLTDVFLPRLDGLDLARRLRAAYGNTIRIVLVSSFQGARERVTSEGIADAYVPKPIDLNHLLRVIASFRD